MCPEVKPDVSHLLGNEQCRAEGVGFSVGPPVQTPAAQPAL